MPVGAITEADEVHRIETIWEPKCFRRRSCGDTPSSGASRVVFKNTDGLARHQVNDLLQRQAHQFRATERRKFS
jgi:hypothetical protein